MGSHPGVSPGAHLLEHLGADRLLGQDEVVQATVDAYHGDVGTQMYRCAAQPLHVQNGVNVQHALVPGRRQVAARRHEAQHRYVDAQPGTYSLLPGDDGGERAEADMMRERLAEAMPAALVPRLHVMDELPVRTSGKVDKKALPWPLPAEVAAVGLTEAAAKETGRKIKTGKFPLMGNARAKAMLA